MSGNNNKKDLNVYIFRNRPGDDDSSQVVPRNAEKVIVHRSVAHLPDAFCGAILNAGNGEHQTYKELQEVVLHKKLQTIGKRAFSISPLKQITIFPSTEIISAKAFERCEFLQKVEFVPTPKRFAPPERFRELGNSLGLKRIMEQSFYRCVALNKISIPSTVDLIGKGAFEESAMKEVDLSNLRFLTDICESTFMHCFDLQAVRLPDSLERILPRAFSGCASLVSVEIPKLERLQIYREAFKGCECLANIKLYEHYVVHPFAFDECLLLHLRYSDIKAYSWPVEEIKRICDQTGCFFFEVDAHCRIVTGLRKRFCKRRVLKMCYRSSTTTIKEFNRAIKDYKKSQKLFVLDGFHMTPFHVLCSSVSPRIDMLQALLDAYPSYILSKKDSNRKLAADYLIDNWSPEAVQILFERWMIERLCRWGIDSRTEDISSKLRNMPECNYEASKLSRTLCEKFQKYETLESLSLLEMAMWKNEINSACNAKRTKRFHRDREACLNSCGSSVILPSVTAFLGLELEASQNRRWKWAASASRYRRGIV